LGAVSGFGEHVLLVQKSLKIPYGSPFEPLVQRPANTAQRRGNFNRIKVAVQVITVGSGDDIPSFFTRHDPQSPHHFFHQETAWFDPSRLFIDRAPSDACGFASWDLLQI
jgi:hypothetical protein